jgi:hypothetical protein
VSCIGNVQLTVGLVQQLEDDRVDDAGDGQVPRVCGDAEPWYPVQGIGVDADDDVDLMIPDLAKKVLPADAA